jgi:hypothetical protein
MIPPIETKTIITESISTRVNPDWEEPHEQKVPKEPKGEITHFALPALLSLLALCFNMIQ